MRNVFVLILPLLLMACAPHKEQVSTPDTYTGSLLDDFKADGASVGAPQNITDLVVVFGDPHAAGCTEPESGAVLEGCCTMQPNHSPTITLLKSEWDQMWPIEQKELMYHELGHCILHRAHRNDLNPQGFACSLMIDPRPGSLPGYWSLGHGNDYILELFGKGPGPGC
jgi:hypothetical protein